MVPFLSLYSWFCSFILFFFFFFYYWIFILWPINTVSTFLNKRVVLHFLTICVCSCFSLSLYIYIYIYIYMYRYIDISFSSPCAPVVVWLCMMIFNRPQCFHLSFYTSSSGLWLNVWLAKREGNHWLCTREMSVTLATRSLLRQQATRNAVTTIDPPTPR